MPLSWFTRLFRAKRRPARSPLRRGPRLEIEALERRELLTTTPLTVQSLPLPTLVQGVETANLSLATFHASTTTSGEPVALLASIAWGDGTTSTGTVSPTQGGGLILGSHRYDATGAFAVDVTVALGQTEASTTDDALVIAAPLSITGTTTPLTLIQGVATSGLLLGTFSAADPNASAADFSASIT